MYAELENVKSHSKNTWSRNDKVPLILLCVKLCASADSVEGSDPNEVQQYYEKVHSVRRVIHEEGRMEKSTAVGFQCIQGNDVEDIRLLKAVQIVRV